MPRAIVKYRMRPHDKQLPQIGIAHLGDTAEPGLATRRVLPRNEPEEGGELPWSREARGIPHAGDQRRRRDRTNPRIGLSVFATGSALASLVIAVSAA